MVELKKVARWDIESLKEEGDKDKFPYRELRLTRVIFRDGQYDIECASVNGSFFFISHSNDGDPRYYWETSSKDILKDVFSNEEWPSAQSE